MSTLLYPPKLHIDKFYYVLKHTSLFSKEQFKAHYYRALLSDSNIRYIRNDFLKGKIKSIDDRFKAIYTRIGEKSESQLEDEFNITLYNIFKFHLDNFIGKSNTENTLEDIELELTSLADLIFYDNSPFRISVEDTTSLRDESGTKGSSFRIKIVPDQLLFQSNGT